MDAKASVKVGPFSRKGYSRVATQACDHDFEAQALVTPVGLLLPEEEEFFLYMQTSKVTSDCLADVLETWWHSVKERFGHIRTLVIDLDNGPECHSHRTQFLFRMVAFSHQAGLDIELAYYPPYHSKYNPVERCWGVLEMHWNGALLDTLETVVRFAETMTWKGKRPVVTLVTKTYPLGVRLTKQAMKAVERQVKRLPKLAKWFVDIPCQLSLDGIPIS